MWIFFVLMILFVAVLTAVDAMFDYLERMDKAEEDEDCDDNIS